MQGGRHGEKDGEKKNTEANHKAEERESCQKENVEAVAVGLEEEKGGKPNSSGTYQGKLLPQGMKIKKRISREENSNSKDTNVDRIADKVKDKVEENPTECKGAEKNISTHKTEIVHSKKLSHTFHDPHKSIPEQPSNGKTCLGNQTDPKVPDSVNKSEPGQSNKDPDSGVSSNTESSKARTHQDDEEDDVVLVSVKPATQRTPPVSTIQKTITTFPGFQSAAKVGDPQGMHSLLTAQLKQKKVSACTKNKQMIKT